MTPHIPDAVSWCLAVGAPAAAVLLLRQRRITGSLGERIGALEASVAARDEAAHRLASVQAPALAAAPHAAPYDLPPAADARLAGTAFAGHLHSVLEQFAGAAALARDRADQSAKTALKGAVRSLQGLANEQQLSISDMQDRHDDPDVLRDLLEIDHANSQFGRRAQAIAVLCGSWPGRQRRVSALSDVVRGAKSRIRDYRRVEVRTQHELAVVSRAVEPVVLAVAELLDNAARHSQPNTTVEVNLQPAHNGACVVIDDAGVGMDEREIRRAGQLLSGQRAVDVTQLGDPPQFGFAVIGVLAARYGFSVSVDTRSPYGGVRAVLFLPSALLTQPEPETEAQPAAAALPAPAPAAPRRTPPAPAPAEAFPAAPLGQTVGGLPKRRRRHASPEQAAALRPAADAPLGSEADWDAAWGRSAEDTARRMGAFARGTRAGRAATTDPEGTPQA
ncbi:ATP-binding protein [Kitasatospora herbaricolor]|uniref:histidine kinase n=1 Tax=Kitasatospora herbaricolor TaxID=68217 RepID=A0ABZ1WB36_9ACTN|nr:ATP-binding protein [Kitasatospora herbaricolor]